MNIDELTIKNIGFDKLNMIKSIIKVEDSQICEEWIDKAEDLSASDLAEEIRDYKDKKKETTMKEIFTSQYLENMVTFFNCSKKELDFKLALYFQNLDLTVVDEVIKLENAKYDISIEQATSKQ